MPIQVLAPDVAARIAAGEVVERPASVVKELVENALDGGATSISVEVQAGGLELVRVTDDGAGIAAADTASLFQRHATSKLRAAEDLAAVHTMGFRGEALYSLGAAAWVTMLTRRSEEPVGVYLEARNSQVIRNEPRGAPAGTTVTVRHLFRDLPARRKFLRSPQAELGRVQNVVAAYVLAFPEVRFSLTSDGRQTLVSPGGGELSDAAIAAHGSQVAPALLPVEGGDGAIAVDGLISPPDVHRANRSYISLFVNRRPIQSRSLVHAVAEAYRGLLPGARYPVAILRIRMSPEELDVNVHPAKAEVRFRQENAVFGALQRTVRQALVALAPVPAFNIIPSPPTSTAPMTLPFPGAAPAHRPSGPAHLPSEPCSLSGPCTEHDHRPHESQPSFQILPQLRAVGQVHETYIVAEGPDGLYLIDQHAAHECVLYEEIREAASLQAPRSQGLLAPATVELTPQQEEAAHEQAELLAQYGWQMEPFGDRTVLLRAVPIILTRKDPAQALRDLLDTSLAEVTMPTWEERVSATVACHAAVRAGMSLTLPEMTSIVHLLQGLQQPHTCPHGRPTMLHLSASALERGFRRR